MTLSLRTTALAALLALGLAAPALASEGGTEIPRYSWSWSGPFGKFDRAQLQRGFQVYKEVCAACHSLGLVAFRTLGQPGGPEFPEDQVKAIAEGWSVKIKDINDSGEVIERAPRPADFFPKPFANEKAAETANGGKAPPDLSLMPKARTYERGFPTFIFDIFTQYQEQGADYVRSFLTGFEEPPAGFVGANYNKYFPGNAVAMPNMLQDGGVEYTDGSPKTAKQYASDVTAFLMWTAEPHLEARKRIGFQVMLFLLVFAVVLYFAKKRVWAGAH